MQRIAAVLSRTTCKAIALRSASRVNIMPLQCTSTRSIHTSRIIYSEDNDNVNGDKTAEELVPDDFFDSESETTKEFLDIISSMATSEKFDENHTNLVSTGLETLTTHKHDTTMEEVIALKDRVERGTEGNPFRPMFDQMETTEGDGDEYVDYEYERKFHPRFMAPIATQSDLGSHLVGDGKRVFDVQTDSTWLGTEDLNMTMPRNFISDDGDSPKEHTSAFLEQFSSKTDEEFPHGHLGDSGMPGSRHCSGKKQRQGKKGQLGCHLIDLETVSPFNITDLKRFLTTDSEIMGKKQTGLCAKCQRKVAKTIKQSRNLGLIAHIDEYVIRDQNPMAQKSFHKGVTHHSKTVL